MSQNDIELEKKQILNGEVNVNYSPFSRHACIDLESRLVTALWMNDTRCTKQ